MGHLTHIVTAGLSARINAELALRAYFEGRPRDAQIAGTSGRTPWSA